ncbi:serine hydrolase [Aquimarina algiphila]|uniref:Serine hydrolase n=1 Tax=Aquimarina algiphila TaxID=2047982 RepID=A0A554VFB3_9FLAO|nr:serine hydrolase [Aquimarina algiphila]TSE05845.1 serine hydrolase [Aquimarina algiphila]
MKNKIISLLIIIVFISCKNEKDPVKSEPLQNKEVDSVQVSIDTNAALALKDSSITSLSVAVYAKEKEYTAHYGELEKGKANPPTDQTFYEIGSVTKTFTGTLVAQAVLDGKLSLDDDIRKYLKGDYDNLKYNGNPILIKHIITHTSSLPKNNKGIDELFENRDDSLAFRVHEIEKEYTKEKLFNHLKEITLDTLPGEKYGYSNLGANLMGHILETAYERTYPELLEQFIFKPSGMTQTKMRLNAEEKKRLARGYNKGVLMPSLPLPETLLGAAGHLKSTMPDLISYMKFQLDSTKKVVQESHSKILMLDEDEWIGYFWPIDKDSEGIYYSHHGGAFGTNTFFFVYPHFEIGIAVSTNSSSPGATGNIRGVVEGILDDIKPFGKKSIGRAIFQKCLDNVDDGIAYYKQLRKDQLETYNFENEFELNSVGYTLLNRGKIEDAIKIFELSVSVFPSASNPYDSLGEGYLENKQYDLALQNYKKSLALDPTNENARVMISKIESIKQ